jgi:hypothetical protein
VRSLARNPQHDSGISLKVGAERLGGSLLPQLARGDDRQRISKGIRSRDGIEGSEILEKVFLPRGKSVPRRSRVSRQQDDYWYKTHKSV